MTWRTGASLLALLALGAVAAPAQAADHRDGALVLQDPSTDINDVYAFTNADATRVTLIMTVFPAATAMSKFSTSAAYVFHTASTNMPLDMALGQTRDIVCTFSSDAIQKFDCWIGTAVADRVTGNTGVTAGVESSSRKVKVYAGLRDDPFFFNLNGFNRVRNLVKNTMGMIPRDANGCPNLPLATRTALRDGLRADMNGTACNTMTNNCDFFRTLNTLAIVVEVDKTLLNAGGNNLRVWAATHKLQ